MDFGRKQRRLMILALSPMDWFLLGLESRKRSMRSRGQAPDSTVLR
jgi:hypothetical protein